MVMWESEEMGFFTGRTGTSRFKVVNVRSFACITMFIPGAHLRIFAPQSTPKREERSRERRAKRTRVLDSCLMSRKNGSSSTGGVSFAFLFPYVDHVLL